VNKLRKVRNTIADASTWLALLLLRLMRAAEQKMSTTYDVSMIRLTTFAVHNRKQA